MSRRQTMSPSPRRHKRAGPHRDWNWRKHYGGRGSFPPEVLPKCCASPPRSVPPPPPPCCFSASAPAVPPRVLATDLGVWVSGFDTDPALVDLAARRLQRAGSAIAKRASAELWAPDSQAVRRQGFHHGLAIEALRHARPLDILPSIVQAIRPGGQFVLQELVATAPEATAQLTAWCAMERRSPELPVEQDITTNLAQLGLDVRVVEDQTDRHASLVLRGWRHMLGGLAGNKPTLAHARRWWPRRKSGCDACA